MTLDEVGFATNIPSSLTGRNIVPQLKASNLTPDITRCPEPVKEFESRRVGGLVQAVVMPRLALQVGRALASGFPSPDHESIRWHPPPLLRPATIGGRS